MGSPLPFQSCQYIWPTSLLSIPEGGGGGAAAARDAAVVWSYYCTLFNTVKGLARPALIPGAIATRTRTMATRILAYKPTPPSLCLLVQWTIPILLLGVICSDICFFIVAILLVCCFRTTPAFVFTTRTFVFIPRLLYFPSVIPRTQAWVLRLRADHIYRQSVQTQTKTRSSQRIRRQLVTETERHTRCSMADKRNSSIMVEERNGPLEKDVSQVNEVTPSCKAEEE